MTIRRLVFGLTVVVFVAAGASCAGKSEQAEVQVGDGGLTATTATTVAVDTTSVPTTAGSTDHDETDDDRAVPPAGPCPQAELEELTALEPGDSPTAADIDRISAAFDRLANTVPPDVAVDIREVGDVLVEYLTALQAIPSVDEYPRSTAVLQQMDRAWAAIDVEKLEAASLRMELYLRAACPDFPFGGEVYDEGEFEPIGEAVN